MLTTYSGINIQKGLLADQCLENIDQLESQEPVYPVLPVRKKPVFVDTFAFPSQEVMLRLLALFAGKPKRMPEKLLLQHQLSTNENKQKVENFVSSVLQDGIARQLMSH